MRIEMEIRYKAEQVWLTTADKLRLHGYWVPCIYAREEESMNQEMGDDSIEGLNDGQKR
jgi:hypothetical protein